MRGTKWEELPEDWVCQRNLWKRSQQLFNNIAIKHESSSILKVDEFFLRYSYLNQDMLNYL